MAQCSQACSHLINSWCFCNHILRGKSLWRWFQCAQFLSTFLVLAFWWYVASISCFQSLNNIVGTRSAAPINQKRSGGEKYECIQSREMKVAPRFNALPKLLHHHRCSKYHSITFTLHMFSQYLFKNVVFSFLIWCCIQLTRNHTALALVIIFTI